MKTSVARQAPLPNHRPVTPALPVEISDSLRPRLCEREIHLMVKTTCPADCACHTGPYASCSVPGGCGSHGCGRSVAAAPDKPNWQADDERACRLCRVYRPDADPQLPDPDLAPVCGRDRRRLDNDLASLPGLHERLRNPDLSTGDERAMYRVDLSRQGRRAWNAMPAGPIAGRTNQPLVSGSRPRREPVDLNAVDLTARVRGTNLTAQGRRYPDDHVGVVSVDTVLDDWVQVWRDALWPDQHRPLARVGELVKWLRGRVELACDRLDVDVLVAFADEIKRLRGTLHAALGEVDAEPDRKIGVRCPNEKCDQVSTLKQDPGDDWIECEACGILVAPEDFKQWVRRWGRYEKSRRTEDEVQELMRR